MADDDGFGDFGDFNTSKNSVPFASISPLTQQEELDATLEIATRGAAHDDSDSKQDDSFGDDDFGDFDSAPTQQVSTPAPIPSPEPSAPLPVVFDPDLLILSGSAFADAVRDAWQCICPGMVSLEPSSEAQTQKGKELLQQLMQQPRVEGPSSNNCAPSTGAMPRVSSSGRGGFYQANRYACDVRLKLSAESAWLLA